MRSEQDQISLSELTRLALAEQAPLPQQSESDLLEIFADTSALDRIVLQQERPRFRRLLLVAAIVTVLGGCMVVAFGQGGWISTMLRQTPWVVSVRFETETVCDALPETCGIKDPPVGYLLEKEERTYQYHPRWYGRYRDVVDGCHFCVQMESIDGYVELEIPAEGTKLEHMQMRGREAYLIRTEREQETFFELLWEEQGIVYFVYGTAPLEVIMEAAENIA